MSGSSDPETGRDYLLNQLVDYRNEKHAKITVVFDAYAGVHLSRSRTNYKGIEVIYSGRDETADDVIRQLIRTRPAGLVVVSSDRALIDEAKRYGVVFMVPGGLEAVLAGESEQEAVHGPTRKGTARKLPKRVRKARRTLGKV
jgi:predicted RNA-binding protein with PIN domain